MIDPERPGPSPGPPDDPLAPSDARAVDVSDARDEAEEEQILRRAWPPTVAYITNFLKTPEGKIFGEKLLSFLESFREQTLNRQHKESIFHGWARYVLVAGIIGAAVWLRTCDKLDTVMVGLLSLTLGYLLGRQQSK
ncbi:MAG: hypothetical protein ACRD1P_11350 [Thermoanaerobaculia bacterium]